MISVVIPSLDPDNRLIAAMAALVPATVTGLVSEVIVVDGGSTNGKAERFADMSGAEFIRAQRGRGSQLAAGAEAARGDWLLFLHDDTVLEPGWVAEVSAFIERVELGGRANAAGAFRFAVDDFGFFPRLLEKYVALRCLLLALPYGDQGLLISRRLYRKLGGFRPLPLMEDVDIVRRLGRGKLVMFRTCAVTSASRFKAEGYILRALRNVFCLLLFYLRVPPRYLVRIYG